ncbi:MAG: NAD kinase [Bacteroidetes bacterium]|nr:MAG: NAD kinase [Bacteroidota bacterium]
MKLAIFGRMTENTDLGVLAQFFAFLQERSIPFRVYRSYANDLSQHLPDLLSPLQAGPFEQPEDLLDCDFLYCFGGDGTVLEAVRFSGRMALPILGVNFGRLGYLTSVTQKQLLAATSELVRGVYRIETRSLLSVISEPRGLFGDNHYGINDLTIHKSRTNEMITVRAYINGEYLNSYWGDGLIVATPTGSTAYSLSCGGPIIFPNSATFTITPVAPHSLTVRPVVIPDDWVVSFEIDSRSGEAMVALDTRTELVKAGTSIAVRRAHFKVPLLRMSATKYVDNLRKSLMWGKDNRN